MFLAFICGAKMAATVSHAKKERRKFLFITFLSRFVEVPTNVFFRCHWPEFVKYTLLNQSVIKGNGLLCLV